MDQPNENHELQKIIVIAPWIKKYLTLEVYIFALNLVKDGWKIMEIPDLPLEQITKCKSIVLCITYDSFDISVLKHPNVKLVYRLDDLYPYQAIRTKCINACDVLIGPYQYLFQNREIRKLGYVNISNRLSYWIPYSAVNEFYEGIEFNSNPIRKILVSGRMGIEFYPFRVWVAEQETLKNQIEILQHPRYENYTHDIINKKFYQKLNEYWCCFTDASAFSYVLLKVFEITSVGSLLLVDDDIAPQLNQLGFLDGIHCIMCNKGNMQQKVNWILDENNIDRINEIRRAGMELTRQQHNTQVRSSTFNTIINDLLQGSS